MSANVPTIVLNLVGQLADIQTHREELSNRIQLYEKKLSMSREAGQALARNEQQVANTLRAHGFNYDQQQFTPLPKESPEEITSLLSNLFQQPTQTQAQTSAAQTLPPHPMLSQPNAPNGPQIRGVPKTTAGMAIRRRT